VERRRGPRRAAELPTPLWRQPVAVGLAIALGVAGGLALGSRSKPPSVVAAQVEAAPSEPPAQLLAAAEALRDEAEALTPAEVALDERAHERWMPRVAKIDAALADPATPAAIRRELEATITALEAVGVLAPAG
jgi:hypothetical protein